MRKPMTKTRRTIRIIVKNAMKGVEAMIIIAIIISFGLGGF